MAGPQAWNGAKTPHSHQVPKESGHFGREALEKTWGVPGIGRKAPGRTPLEIVDAGKSPLRNIAIFACLRAMGPEDVPRRGGGNC